MTQQRVVGQGEAAAGSLSYLRGPGDTAGHRQGIRSLRSWQGRRFPRFREDLGGNARGMRQEAAAQRSHTSGKPHGTRTDSEPRARAPPPASKAETAAGRGTGRASKPPPGIGKAQAAPGDAQSAPQPESTAGERQDSSHQRSGQQGPHGDVGRWRAWRCLESLKPSGKMDLVTTHLCPSAKIVQIPCCPESSSAVLRVGDSAVEHQDRQIDAKKEQRSPQGCEVTSASPGVLQETGQHWSAGGEGGSWLLPLAN